MNIQEITKILSDSGIEENEAKAEAKILVQNCLELNSVKLAIKPEFEPNEKLKNSIIIVILLKY